MAKFWLEGEQLKSDEDLGKFNIYCYTEWHKKH